MHASCSIPLAWHVTQPKRSGTCWNLLLLSRNQFQKMEDDTLISLNYTTCSPYLVNICYWFQPSISFIWNTSSSLWFRVDIQLTKILVFPGVGMMTHQQKSRQLEKIEKPWTSWRDRSIILARTQTSSWFGRSFNIHLHNIVILWLMDICIYSFGMDI